MIDYELSYYATQYRFHPDGLGHEKDISVLDMVAHVSVKTPTAAAEWLIEQLSNQAWQIEQQMDKLVEVAGRTLEQHKWLMSQLSGRITQSVQARIGTEWLRLERFQGRLQQQTGLLWMRAFQSIEFMLTKLQWVTQARREQERSRIEGLEVSVKASSPEQILKKGFSITCIQGKPVRSVAFVQVGDKLETFLADGKISSTVSFKATNHE